MPLCFLASKLYFLNINLVPFQIPAYVFVILLYICNCLFIFLNISFQKFYVLGFRISISEILGHGSAICCFRRFTHDGLFACMLRDLCLRAHVCLILICENLGYLYETKTGCEHSASPSRTNCISFFLLLKSKFLHRINPVFFHTLNQHLII